LRSAGAEPDAQHNGMAINPGVACERRLRGQSEKPPGWILVASVAAWLVGPVEACAGDPWSGQAAKACPDRDG